MNNGTVTISLDKFQKMQDICEGRDQELIDLREENERLIETKNILTVQVKPRYHWQDEKNIHEEVIFYRSDKIEERFGVSFDKLNRYKEDLRERIERLNETIDSERGCYNQMIYEVEQIKSKWWYKLFSKK